MRLTRPKLDRKVTLIARRPDGTSISTTIYDTTAEEVIARIESLAEDAPGQVAKPSPPHPQPSPAASMRHR